VQIALFDENGSTPVDTIDVETDLRTLLPNESQTLTAKTSEPLATTERYRVGLRIFQPGAEVMNSEKWKLKARNAYILIANDIEVIDGIWDEDNTLRGGWNILGEIRSRATIPQLAEEGFIPFRGSFRPIVRP